MGAQKCRQLMGKVLRHFCVVRRRECVAEPTSSPLARHHSQDMVHPQIWLRSRQWLLAFP
jgi:hypothetical protein